MSDQERSNVTTYRDPDGVMVYAPPPLAPTRLETRREVVAALAHAAPYTATWDELHMENRRMRWIECRVNGRPWLAQWFDAEAQEQGWATDLPDGTDGDTKW